MACGKPPYLSRGPSRALPHRFMLHTLPCLPPKAPLNGHLNSHLCSVAPSRGALSCPCSASPPARGPNASGFVVVALSATLASSTLVITSAGAGTAFTALHTP